MIKFGVTIIWIVVAFLTLTLLTMEGNAYQDGVDRYGFPFTFYDYFGGYCNNCYYKYGFKPIYLLFDIGLTTLIVILALKLKSKLLVKRSK